MGGSGGVEVNSSRGKEGKGWTTGAARVDLDATQVTGPLEARSKVQCPRGRAIGTSTAGWCLQDGEVTLVYPGCGCL